MVSSFGFEEAAKKIGKLLIIKAIAKQTKSLARAGFDQASDEQAVDGFIRLLFADEVVEFASVA